MSWLLTIIKTGLFASLFMPLIVSGTFIFPYIFPKQILFQIVVEIIFALYLFLALREPTYRPRSSWLFKAILIYFVVMVLSSVFGVNTYHSFWSNYERMAGLVSLFHYLGFLFVAVNVFKRKENWHTFFDCSVIASVLEALFGFAQMLGIFASSGGVRIDGTIGNASFLAGYLLINAFFAFWLMLEKRDMVWRSFYIFAIVINLFIMYQTQTRGAVLALVLGLICLAIFFVFTPKKSIDEKAAKSAAVYKKIGLALLVGVVLAAGLIWLARDSRFVVNNPTLYRVTHISLQETTGQTRFLAWKMSLRGFVERPIFGWGPENYYILFNKYYDPNLYPVESWFDRAHNAYLDILVNTGLVGMAGYLAMIGLAFRYLWRAWRRGKINYFTAAIFSVILIAYGAQNFFVFDTQVTLLMFYAILAFIVWLSFGAPADKAGQPVKPNYVFNFLVMAVILLVMYFVNIKPALASVRGIAALQFFQQGQTEQSLAKFKEAYDIGTFGLPEVAMRAQDIAVKLIVDTSVPEQTRQQFVETAVDGMKRALEKEPLNARFMMILSSVYLSSAKPTNSYLADADLLLQKAMELSPTRQELHFYVGQLRMFQGRFDEALALFKAAVDLNDKVELSHWNYGVIAIGLNHKELGEGEIKRARELGHPFQVADIKQLINAYDKTSDWPKIISLYQEWILQTPADAAPYAGLAATYARSGDKQKAKEAALKAVEVNPNYQAEAEQFIKGLGL
ncbi:MAG TPA: hypothetical protein DHI91_03055 [Candidatus Portnoybacteria bacterium]|nr:hypothetical protein [Candidatus Portnoybacteria bacterium]